MRTSTISFLPALFVGLASCATSNHRFDDWGGLPPDVQALEQARQELVSTSGAERDLQDLSWFPLVVMDLKVYAEASPAMQPGTRYSDFESYGPLFMFADAQTCHYDEQQTLYERRQEAIYLWGLLKSKNKQIRVPAGWRLESETRALFGLLRWPSVSYSESLPEPLTEPLPEPLPAN